MNYILFHNNEVIFHDVMVILNLSHLFILIYLTVQFIYFILKLHISMLIKLGRSLKTYDSPELQLVVQV